VRSSSSCVAVLSCMVMATVIGIRFTPAREVKFFVIKFRCDLVRRLLVNMF